MSDVRDRTSDVRTGGSGAGAGAGDVRPGRPGRLKVYLGAAPGVGKTYRMLDEARRRAARGVDVVVGFVECHGRPRTEGMLDGLEVVERAQWAYRGGEFEEMDLAAVLARRPQVAIVDEFAHSNVPGGGRNPKRRQDIEELLAAGIDVVTALNVQHLALNAAASLGDEVRAVTVCNPDPEDRAQLYALERDWARWDPGVPLIRLTSERRALGRPIAAYVGEAAAAVPGTRVTVLIPEAEPDRLWQRLLQNQRGAVVAHAVRKDTDAVICRLRFLI
ncbi:histidine kinase [Streptomyces umbrinus]|nr:hypothetical protein [Streptomyces umbrinus]